MLGLAGFIVSNAAFKNAFSLVSPFSNVSAFDFYVFKLHEIRLIGIMYWIMHWGRSSKCVCQVIITETEVVVSSLKILMEASVKGELTRIIHAYHEKRLPLKMFILR